MTKAGDKLLNAAKEAVDVAKCDHEMLPQPRLNHSNALDRFYCPKCKATFYVPRPMWRR